MKNMKHTLSKKDVRALGDQLRKLGFKTYAEFLTSDLWRDFARRLKQNIEYKNCSHCNSIFRIALHHKKYHSLLDPQTIIPLCANCHEEIHAAVTKKTTVSKATLSHGDRFTAPLPPKWQRRQNSVRIIKDSGLPAVLHHSIHAYSRFNTGKFTVDQIMEKWLKKKRKNNDEILLRLYVEYKPLAWKLMSQLLSKPTLIPKRRGTLYFVDLRK